MATLLLNLQLFQKNYANSAVESHSRFSSSNMLPFPRRTGLALRVILAWLVPLTYITRKAKLSRSLFPS